MSRTDTSIAAVAASIASPRRSTIVSMAARIDDEGRRQQHVVAAHAVDRPAHRIDHQPARHRFALDARMQLQFRVERLLAAAIGDELEALEQAASAHVADEGMIAEPLASAGARDARPARARCAKQIVAAYHPLHRQRRGAGERMTHIGVAVLEGARALARWRRKSCSCISSAPIGA